MGCAVVNGGVRGTGYGAHATWLDATSWNVRVCLVILVSGCVSVYVSVKVSLAAKKTTHNA